MLAILAMTNRHFLPSGGPDSDSDPEGQGGANLSDFYGFGTISSFSIWQVQEFGGSPLFSVRSTGFNRYLRLRCSFDSA